MRGLDQSDDTALTGEELAFYLENRAQWSKDYPAGWVAIVGHEVVGIATDLDDAISQAQNRGFDDPFVAGLLDPALTDAAFIASL